MWVLWIVLSNVSVTYLEWAYRTAKYPSFIESLPHIIVPILVTQVGLFYGFRQAPSMFLCAAVFTTINTVLRVATVLYLGEKMLLVNWIGVGLLFIGVVLLKWR
jgi:drug/metabolite transporter (DMT)-like permease